MEQKKPDKKNQTKMRGETKKNLQKKLPTPPLGVEMKWRKCLIGSLLDIY